jgi:hypothetical protein
VRKAIVIAVRLTAMIRKATAATVTEGVCHGCTARARAALQPGVKRPCPQPDPAFASDGHAGQFRTVTKGSDCVLQVLPAIQKEVAAGSLAQQVWQIDGPATVSPVVAFLLRRGQSGSAAGVALGRLLLRRHHDASGGSIWPPHVFLPGRPRISSSASGGGGIILCGAGD